MLNHNHFLLGLIVAAPLYFFGVIDLLMVLALFIGSGFLDLDWWLPGYHREMVSHTPLPWQILSLGIMFPETALIGWMAFGCLTHLILDSLDWGIMWFWPLSTKRYFHTVYNWKHYFAEPRFRYIEMALIAGATVTILVDVLFLLLLMATLVWGAIVHSEANSR